MTNKTKFYLALGAFIFLGQLVQAGEVAVGSAEVNGDTNLVLSNANHRSPKQKGLLGIRHYGFGYGQFEFGRYLNVRARNNGGFILHGLESDTDRGVSALIGIEPVSGEVKTGSTQDGTRYLYQPAISYGGEFRAPFASLVLLSKTGYSAHNLYNTKYDLSPKYDFFKSTGAYLSSPGFISYGYTTVELESKQREIHSLMLFTTVHLVYEENHSERVYSVVLDL